MAEAKKCIKLSIGNKVPEYKTTRATMADGKPYALPSWRIDEIIILAVKTLNEVGYFNNNFDYKQMIRNEGIKLRKFSSFAVENLESFRGISLSRWNEGLCAIFPDPVTGEQCRMIAYNDRHSASECMQIIFHEFAHIKLRHTQQSVNGEMEAACFALAMTIFIIIEFRLKNTQLSFNKKEAASKPY